MLVAVVVVEEEEEAEEGPDEEEEEGVVAEMAAVAAESFSSDLAERMCDRKAAAVKPGEASRMGCVDSRSMWRSSAVRVWSKNRLRRYLFFLPRSLSPVFISKTKKASPKSQKIFQ